MFDNTVYNSILQAAFEILQRNGNRLGREFCEGFMFDHDTRNGQSSQYNAQNLFDFIVRETQRLNGSTVIRDDSQLFSMVGPYIENLYGQWASRQNNGSFGRPQSTGYSGPSVGTPFNRGGFMNQSGRPTPSSHLIDDTIRPASESFPIPRSQSTGTPVVPTPPPAPTQTFSDNPMDTLTVDQSDFSSVGTASNWGQEAPRDRRIVVAKRETMRTTDNKFMMNRFRAFHQVIHNDPRDVVKDFFKVAPDSTLGTSYMFQIFYNHLDVINVPTSDFVSVRDACMASLKQHNQVPLYKALNDVFNSMSRGPWKAMTTYLVQHINRALHLNCRLASNPSLFIQISTYDDLDELLSSQFKHPFTTLPEGRYQLERIVSGAIWNALVLNAFPMFTDRNVPVNAIQSSPAFPFSLDEVYPNKFAIPTAQDATFGQFFDRLTEYELSKRTYVLSRRSVVATNVLGGAVLGNLKPEPQMFDHASAYLMLQHALSYTKLNIQESDPIRYDTFLSEDYPSDQLEQYYTNTNDSLQADVDRYARVRPTAFPLDQHIFATQYSISPYKYMVDIDVFSTLDSAQGKPGVVLGRNTSSNKTA